MPEENRGVLSLARQYKQSNSDVFEFLEIHSDASLTDHCDVLLVDLEQKWQSDQSIRIETYLSTFPEIASDVTLKLKLVLAEYQARLSQADPPSISEYIQRFPDLTDQLQNQQTITIINPASDIDDPALAQTFQPSSQPGVESTSPNTATQLSKSSRFAAGYQFGDYVIEGEIARGGMGVVFKAQQVSLNRPVALKMILSSHLAGTDEIIRFQAEAESAAKLDHPGIVPVYEVGAIENQNFFSMGFVEGGSLTDLLVDGPIEGMQAAQLVKSIAEAVQYAHTRNIVHRDLKPVNVLLDEERQPKITDFGLAKNMVEDSGLTATGAVMGTPGYMAPEQAAGKLDEVGPLADVYSIGGILYFLLTGQPPFKGTNPIETIRQVISVEPVSPRQYNNHVDLDLATICLKCLEKEPGRRYASAGELSEELNLYLENRPITARPVSSTEKVWRWCKRNPSVACMSFVISSLLVFLLVAGPTVYFRELKINKDLLSTQVDLKSATQKAQSQTELAKSQAELAQSQTELATLRLAESYFDNAIKLCEEENVANGLLLMARSLKLLPPEHQKLEQAIRINIDSWSKEIFATPKYFFDYPIRATAATFLPAGDKVLVGCEDGSVVLWDLHTSSITKTSLKNPNGIHRIILSIDTSKCITIDQKDIARIWHYPTQKQIGEDESKVRSASFSIDHKHIFIGTTDQKLYTLDALTGTPLKKPTSLQTVGQSLDVSSDGKYLLISDKKQSVGMHDLLTGEVTRRFSQHNHENNATSALDVAWSPDDTLIATADNYGVLRLYDSKTGNLRGKEFHFRYGVHRVEFSPDGSRVLCGSRDRTARLFDTATGKQVGTTIFHRKRVLDLSFSQTKNLFLTVAAGQLRVFSQEPVGKNSDSLIYQPMDNGYKGFLFTYYVDNGKKFAVEDASRIKLFDTKTKTFVKQHEFQTENIFGGAYHAGKSYFCRLFLKKNKMVHLFDVDQFKPLSDQVGPILYGRPEMWLHPDKEIFVTRYGDFVRLWSTKTGKQICKPLLHPAYVRVCAFSPDGATLATACEDGFIRFWNIPSGEQAGQTIEIEEGLVFDLMYTPDGQNLVCNALVTTVWDVATLERIAFADIGRPFRLAVANNSRFILVAGESWDTQGTTAPQILRIWDTITNRPVSRIIHFNTNLITNFFSPDGSNVITSSTDGNVRIFDVLDPIQGSPEEVENWLEVNTTMYLNEKNEPELMNAKDWRERRQLLKFSPFDH